MKYAVKITAHEGHLIFDGEASHSRVMLAGTDDEGYRTTITQSEGLIGISDEAWTLMSKCKAQKEGGSFLWFDSGDMGYGVVLSWNKRPRAIFEPDEMCTAEGHSMFENCRVAIPNDVPEAAKDIIDNRGPHGLGCNCHRTMEKLKELGLLGNQQGPSLVQQAMRATSTQGGDFASLMGTPVPFDPDNLN